MADIDKLQKSKSRPPPQVGGSRMKVGGLLTRQAGKNENPVRGTQASLSHLRGYQYVLTATQAALSHSDSGGYQCLLRATLRHSGGYHYVLRATEATLRDRECYQYVLEGYPGYLKGQ
jgi:hypothetical protein